MTTRRGLLTTIGAGVGSLWLRPAVTATATRGNPRDRTVVLISLDGFPAWLWRDGSLPIPTLRRLAGAGAVADAMTVSNPSVTWINHTTLVTGVSPAKHGVLYNGLLVRQGEDQPPKIEPWRPKEELVRVPTLYDLAHAAALTTAEVDWVAIHKAKTITWSYPELPDPSGPVEKELIASGRLTEDEAKNLGEARRNIAWRDQMWTKAACHIVRAHRPNLLLFHLLTTDTLNHTFGPGSLASHAAYGYVDRLVGELLEAVRATFKDRATVVITTDHGFKRVTKQVFPNIALRKAGLLTAVGPLVTRCDAFVLAQGGMGQAFVTSPAKRAELVPRLRDLLMNVEGVESVHNGNEAPKFGMPTPEMNQGMGDLFLFAKNGYAFAASAAGDAEAADSPNYRGSHGYPASDPELDGMFLAWGHGIRRGARLPRISNLDVAPTLARVMGLRLPEAEGCVLKEALSS